MAEDRFDRRTFIRNVSGTAAVVSVLPTAMPAVPGAQMSGADTVPVQAPAVRRNLPTRIRFSVIGLNHGHINSMTHAVIRGGGELVSVYAREPELLAQFRKQFPMAASAPSEQAVLDDPTTQAVLSASVPDERAPLGVRVTSLTIAEGRALSHAVHRSGRIFQIGSQQRSSPPWRYAAELVRNGRIGQLKTVQVGLPGDPSGPEEPPQPIPATLDYEMWLGSTPYVYYTENRVHPQNGYGRPGWLRSEQFGAGMITGWGAHHLDCAHWAMDTEHTGPIEISGSAQFPSSGLWDVHGPFKTEGLYANGVRMVVSGDFPNGIRFEGTDGWIFVSRGNEAVTASDPQSRLSDSQALAASNPAMLKSVIGPDEVHLEVSTDHHGNWLDAIRTRRQPITPVEIAHRSCSACLLHHIAMKVNRPLFWYPIRERFRNDDDANAMLSRPQRAPWGLPA